MLASRGCPEFCTYCPHRFWQDTGCDRWRTSPTSSKSCAPGIRTRYIVFRDPLFSEDRERCLALCDEIGARGLKLRFECETRLDRLDPTLLYTMQRAGLRAMSFGVESMSPETLKKAGRRPIPQAHQREIMSLCRELGIKTAGILRAGLPAGHLGVHRDDDRLCDPDGIDVRAIQNPHAVSRGRRCGSRCAHLVYETDWQKFDGFTPTFTHPNLTPTS